MNDYHTSHLLRYWLHLKVNGVCVYVCVQISHATHVLVINKSNLYVCFLIHNKTQKQTQMHNMAFKNDMPIWTHLNYFQERNQQAPRVRSVHNQPLEQHASDLLLDDLLQCKNYYCFV